MIEIIEIGMADAIAYRIKGKITKEEMKTRLAVFKKKQSQAIEFLKYG